MAQPTEAPDWREAAPPTYRKYIKEMETLADTALKSSLPFHSVRLAKRIITEAGSDAGRVLGWIISATTQQGWEYENTTLDSEGSFWLLFKNPYVFS